MKYKKILNVGCGSQKYGTDFIDIYPSRKEVIKCDVAKEKFPYKEETFDEVYSKNLFEHIANLPHLLNEMKRVSQTGAEEGYKASILKEAQNIVDLEWFKLTYQQSQNLIEFYELFKKLKNSA